METVGQNKSNSGRFLIYLLLLLLLFYFWSISLRVNYGHIRFRDGRQLSTSVRCRANKWRMYLWRYAKHFSQLYKEPRMCTLLVRAAKMRTSWLQLRAVLEHATFGATSCLTNHDLVIPLLLLLRLVLVLILMQQEQH